jgi:catechol 2,3-dioxygenase-like lactoylglutathione lyase family enzyme
MTRILHAAIAVRSEAAARELFESVFELPEQYRFDVEESVCRLFFDVNFRANVIVFGCENATIEVFVLDKPYPLKAGFRHICLGFDDRLPVIERARKAGYRVEVLPRDSDDVIFIQDHDGNLYEIKNSGK